MIAAPVPARCGHGRFSWCRELDTSVVSLDCDDGAVEFTNVSRIGDGSGPGDPRGDVAGSRSLGYMRDLETTVGRCGFDLAIFADMLDTLTRFTDAGIPMRPAEVGLLREFFTRWAAELRS